jgi:hypothetical protein
VKLVWGGREGLGVGGVGKERFKFSRETKTSSKRDRQDKTRQAQCKTRDRQDKTRKETDRQMVSFALV